MALFESHDCNWEVSGCAIRSILVRFSYDFKAASKVAWMCEEAAEVEGVWDMGETVTLDGSEIISAQVDVEILGRWCALSCGQASITHKQISATADANVYVTIGAKIDARITQSGLPVTATSVIGHQSPELWTQIGKNQRKVSCFASNSIHWGSC